MLEADLAALAHIPPTCESQMLNFLISPLLASLLEENPLGERLQRHLSRRSDLRQAAQRWCEFKLEQAELDAGEEKSASDLKLLLLLVQYFSQNQTISAPAATAWQPAGCVRCVLVDPAGKAATSRVYVRFGKWNMLDQAPMVGQIVPGAGMAIDAARHYLAMSGSQFIDDLQTEILVEGLFRPVQGDSLALAIFIAAISARLQIPVRSDLAFSGAIAPRRRTLRPAP